MKTYISNCCGAEMPNTDTDFCPSCGEHCEIEEVNEDAEADAKEIDNSIMGQMDTISEMTEELKKIIK